MIDLQQMLAEQSDKPQNKNEIWLTDRVTYLKGLKSPTEQQQLLVLLAEKSARTPQDEKKLAALVKAEKAIIRANKAKQEAANMINADKKAASETERKARTHRLIQQGGLVDLAGLEHRSKGELLGLLIEASTSTNETKWAQLKQLGDAALAKAAEK